MEEETVVLNSSTGAIQRREYVVAYAKLVGPHSSDILVVLKNKPAWQKGRFNLVGGKIEEGETPIQAAERELMEEAGLRPASSSTLMGKITGSWGNVYCVRIPVFDREISQGPNETEIVAWVDWHELRQHPLLIPNLRVILPLCMMNCTGWVVLDEGPSWQESTHTISITVPSDKRE